MAGSMAAQWNWSGVQSLSLDGVPRYQWVTLIWQWISLLSLWEPFDKVGPLVIVLPSQLVNCRDQILNPHSRCPLFCLSGTITFVRILPKVTQDLGIRTGVLCFYFYGVADWPSQEVNWMGPTVTQYWNFPMCCFNYFYIL